MSGDGCEGGHAALGQARPGTGAIGRRRLMLLAINERCFEHQFRELDVLMGRVEIFSRPQATLAGLDQVLIEAT
jgi:hypothetical protein